MNSDFILAESLSQVLSAMRNGYTVLAGGTEINRLGSKIKHDGLVSVNRVEGFDSILEITLEDGNNYVAIGATCTFQKAIESDLVPFYFKNSCKFMSSRIKRNMATIGGNIASVRDDSYLWSALIASSAKLRIVKQNGRSSLISSVEYLSDAAVYYNCLISEILLPKNISLVSKRYSNTASSHAFLTVSVGKSDKGISIGICIKNDGIYESYNIEDLKQIKFKSDMFGSKEYKKYLLEVTVEDILKILEA